jgi:hypothetical protein
MDHDEEDEQAWDDKDEARQADQMPWGDQPEGDQGDLASILTYMMMYGHGRHRGTFLDILAAIKINLRPGAIDDEQEMASAAAAAEAEMRDLLEPCTAVRLLWGTARCRAVFHDWYPTAVGRPDGTPPSGGEAHRPSSTIPAPGGFAMVHSHREPAGRRPGVGGPHGRQGPYGVIPRIPRARRINIDVAWQQAEEDLEGRPPEQEFN